MGVDREPHPPEVIAHVISVDPFVGSVSLESPMSNTTTWSVLGPIVVLVGVVLAVAAWRPRR
ncbi:hypothetical protein K0O64_15275 [Mycolicibacterium pallens]|uniref:Uncharacterized protein n=1 Tax=Mycolicibacterium pallens TaxID=370524 RepID=A0ABX8VV61_9MYCO|nr:hypothetical protein K0O64_15275 [Mycolicibacterium pallens]